jgi:hypothetical protein
VVKNTHTGSRKITKKRFPLPEGGGGKEGADNAPPPPRNHAVRGDPSTRAGEGGQGQRRKEEGKGWTMHHRPTTQ